MTDGRVTIIAISAVILWVVLSFPPAIEAYNLGLTIPESIEFALFVAIRNAPIVYLLLGFVYLVVCDQ